MKKRICKTCDYPLHASIEGDYCPECLNFNRFMRGDYNVTLCSEVAIRKDWKDLFQFMRKYSAVFTGAE